MFLVQVQTGTNRIDLNMRHVALVLSGGGARRCTYVRAIKVLKQNGFRSTSVDGTFMGWLAGLKMLHAFIKNT
jgi:predicted acylesterase/phospholipase RssA